MDPVTRDITIRDLKDHLKFCQLQFASLDNDAHRRNEMADTCYAIQLLLDFLESEQKKVCL